jgi:RNA polymerase sigma factor for flagellar operon FliA
MAGLVSLYKPLILHILNRRILKGLAPQGLLSYEDLLQEGTFGFIQAVLNHDTSRKAKISTYAYVRIRGAILDALRVAYTLTRKRQHFGDMVERASDGLRADLGREPTRKELAEELGLPPEDLETNLASLRTKIVSLEELLDETADGNVDKISETADDDPWANPESVFQSTALAEALHEEVERPGLLDDRERLIIGWYDGVGPDKEEGQIPLWKVGVALGISETRASQLRIRALNKLRKSPRLKSLVSVEEPEIQSLQKASTNRAESNWLAIEKERRDIIQGWSTPLVPAASA